MEERIQEIAKTYWRRRFHLENPSGHFNRGGRWFPDAREEAECCAHIRPPSRAYPYSLMQHCRSLKHLAMLYRIEPKALRKAAKAVRDGVLDELREWLQRYRQAYASSSSSIAIARNEPIVCARCNQRVSIWLQKEYENVCLNCILKLEEEEK